MSLGTPENSAIQKLSIIIIIINNHPTTTSDHQDAVLTKQCQVDVQKSLENFEMSVTAF